jgi:hypothetical protein
MSRIGTGTLIVLSLVYLISGCAPRFQMVEKVEDKALIYVYRPVKYFQGGLNYTVNANGFKVDTLFNGGYFSYIAKPGRIQFSIRSEITTYLTLDVEPGQTYFIRGFTQPGSLVPRPHLRLVPPELGKREIALCRKKGQGKSANSSLPLEPDKSKEQ